MRGSGSGIYLFWYVCIARYWWKYVFDIFGANVSVWAQSLYGIHFLCGYRYEHNGIVWLRSYHSKAICLILVVYHSEVGFILNCTLNTQITHVSILPFLLLPYAFLWNFNTTWKDQVQCLEGVHFHLYTQRARVRHCVPSR